MAYKDRTYLDPIKRGRGRFVVSEGVAPAEKIQPDDALPTLLVDPVHDEFFEVVMLKGTIVSVYPPATGTGANAEEISYVAGPCVGGETGYELKAIFVATTGATSGTISTSAVTTAPAAGYVGSGYVPKSGYELKGIPQGVLTQDAYRPFSYGDNEGISFITHGYVEWPLVMKYDTITGSPAKIFDNTDLAVGDFVMPDALGRPVKWTKAWPEHMKVARVVKKELIASDWDFGYLQYMQLPVTDFENALLKTVYNTHYVEANDTNFNATATGHVFGVRPNIDALLDNYEVATYGADAAAGVLGAVRCQLLG